MDDVGTTLCNNQDDSSLVRSYVIKEILRPLLVFYRDLENGVLSWFCSLIILLTLKLTFQINTTGIDLNFGMGFASESTAYVSAGYSSAGVLAGAGCRFLFFNLRAALVPSSCVCSSETADGKQRESYYKTELWR